MSSPRKLVLFVVAFVFSLLPFAGTVARAASSAVIAGSTLTLSVTADGTQPFSYAWYKDGTALPGATNANISINNIQSGNAGTYSAIVSNSAGSATSDDMLVTVTTGSIAPSITTQPVSQTVMAGSNVSFTAAASGAPAPTYQWNLNGAAISGATSATLNISNAQYANAGNYTLVATNSAGSVASNGATLTVSAAVAPTFTTQPVSQTVTAGATVTFTSLATGTPAPTYQWKLNGTTIPNATNASVTQMDVGPSDNGTWTVVATNSAGSVTSSATLTIASASVAPTITTQPVSQTATAGANVTFTAAASGTPTPTYQWKLNGTAISGATNATLNISNVQSGNTGTYTMVATNSAGSVTSNGATLSVTVVSVAPSITTQPASQTVTAGANVTFTAAANGTPAPTYQWKLNGAAISGATNSTLSVTNAQSGNAGSYTLVATNSAGSATSNAATLTVNPVSVAPSITTQPTSQTVTVGANVTFTAAANGTPAPSYQWKLNGAAISGATNASLSVANAQSANAGSYTLVATNSAGSATSNAATLTVNPVSNAPTFTTQPVSQTLPAGSTVTFTAAATGTPAPTYQWKFNGKTIPGAKNATLINKDVGSSDVGTYTVIATNSAGSVTSNGATLTIGAASVAPTITTQPINQTVTAGANVTFTAAANGTPAPSYQWKLNGAAISGATNASLNIANAQSANAGSYTLVATNSAGSVTSNAATLTVNPVTVAPTFTTQPVNQTVIAGANVTLTAAANGTPAPTYQWKLNGAAISGATNASLSIANAQSANAGSYTLIATNSAGSVTSNVATLTVNPAPVPPTITAQPLSQTVTAGANVTFKVTATSENAMSYQWRLNGTAIPNATSASYSIAAVAAANNGTYTVTVTDKNGSVVSAGAVLTVNATTAPVVLRADFNSDGKADILWQNSVTGEVSVWLMAGTTRTSAAMIGTASLDQKVCGTGDFNNDGKTDILWQNTATGECSVWLMSGTTVSKIAVLGTVSSEWQMRESGDFNSDGMSDILWQNQVTGECGFWLMSGTTISSGGTIGVYSSDLVIAGTGDFNRDGQSDVLWQNSATGEFGVWLMAGTTVASNVSIATLPLSWLISGAGDFNADGSSDILMQNVLNGEAGVWLMNGTAASSKLSLGTVLTDWVIRN